MLYKSLHFKLVLIFVFFIISIISIVGTIMLNGVFSFYTSSFTNQIEEGLAEFKSELEAPMKNSDEYYIAQKDRLLAHAGKLGINKYRNFYILSYATGKYLAGTDADLGAKLVKTQNMLSAMTGVIGSKHIFGANYMDYAMPLIYEDAKTGIRRECIIYIIDTQEDMRKFTWMMVSIIIQSLLLGLGIAVFLSFFLANAITSPIQNITKGAVKLAAGDFKKKIEVTSNDEIGLLTETFNNMANTLQNTLDEVSGEREKLQIIFLYLKDGVLVFSADDTLILMNPQGADIMGDDFSYDNNFNDFLELFNLKENYKRETEKSESKESGGLHFKDAAYRDDVFDINIGKFKYKQQQSNFEGIIVVLHDITQQYALEKSRREFIADVSHELKTPLTTIRGAAESIIINPGLSEKWKDKFLNDILSESIRMTEIVQDLLLISQVENKKMMWKFKLVKPDLMAQNIYDTMLSVANKGNHTLNLTMDENIEEISADKGRIEQVLINIISNAIKYTKPGGTINFCLSNYEMQDFSGVKFTVSDNGIGIPEKDLPHIFERFYRVDKSRSTETGSTGLGLAIAKEIVHAHKGEITIDSKINSGTTMTIILPRNIWKGGESVENNI